MAKAGQPSRRKSGASLQARIKAWDAGQKGKAGYRRPGSNKK